MLEDLSALFADFGTTATYGAIRATVLFDLPDKSLMHDMQISSDYAITYAAGDLAGLKHGDSIGVNGTTYTVREVTHLDDGQLMRATLMQ